MEDRDLRLLGSAAAVVVVLGSVCAAPHSAGTPTPNAGVQRPLAPVEREMLGAAMDTIVAHLADSTVLCVTMMDGPEGATPPDDDLLARLSRRRRAVRGADCPPTYTSMVRTPSDRPRPAGYIDPYRFTIGRPQFEQQGYAWIHIRQLQGTTGRAYLCTAQVYRDRILAHCRTVSSWIH